MEAAVLYKGSDVGYIMCDDPNRYVSGAIESLNDLIKVDFARKKMAMQKNKFRKNFNKRKAGWRV